MKLYEPQPSDPRVPAIVIEEDGQRFLVTSAGLGDPTKAYDHKKPYTGAVRKDSFEGPLRGMACGLGVPGWKDAECPNVLTPPA